MKLLILAAATAFLLSGTTGYAQMSPGSPAAAKQGSADPLIKEPTYDQIRRSPRLARRDRGPTNGRLGGPPGESRAQAAGASSSGK
jgi:hypothetical protein